jgi:hypothetical protein
MFGAVAGAFIAFELERRRRRGERRDEEIGKLYTLHFFVMHMASVLVDFEEHLFGMPGEPARNWDDIGSLEGAPERGSEFETQDYAFLLNGAKKDVAALSLLNKIYLARVNFNSTLTRLHIRNQLWNELFEHRIGDQFSKGQTAIDRIGQQQAVAARIAELTEWLRKDFKQTIAELEAIQPMLQQVFAARYPKVPFIASVRREDAEGNQQVPDG